MAITHLHMISLDEVADIFATSPEHALRWLKKNRITVHSIDGEKRVFELDVLYCLHLMYARELIKKYAHRWEAKYRLIAHDATLCELVIAEIRNAAPTKPTTRIQNLTENDKSLIKKLNE